MCFSGRVDMAAKETPMLGYDPAVRTRTLSRMLGPYLLAAAAALFARQDGLSAFLTEFMQDGPLVFVTGAFTLIAGVAIISAHHHWTSPSAILVSLIGILAALKGASLMIAPELGADMTDAVVRTPSYLWVGIGVDFLLGLWLTITGWFRPAPAPLAQ
jgi:hypothetical protein